MICNEAEELITEYLEDALPASRRADFEAHLETCSHCQTSLGEMRAVIEGSHTLGVKLRQDWRARSAGNQDQFLERLEARALKQSRAPKSRYRRLAPAAAVVAVVAIAAGVWIHEQSAKRAALPQSLTVDLSHWMRLRGAGQPPPPTVELKPARLNLTILLPVGTLPGKFQVAIWKGRKVIAQAATTGEFINHLTALHVQMNCSHLKRGDYTLAIRLDDLDWEEYPAVIR